MESAVVGPRKSRKRKAPQVSLNEHTGSPTETILKTKNKLSVSSRGKDRRLSASVKRNSNVILALEAVPQTENEHEVRKVPQKRMQKRRTGKGNKNPVEREKIKLHSSLEKNHLNQNLMENKLGQFDRNVSTASLNSTTASKVNHKVDIATLCKVQNGNVPVDKCLEAASQTADKHEEVCVVRRKRTSKGRRRNDQENKNMDLNLEEDVCNLFDKKNPATLSNIETVCEFIQNQEVTGDTSSEAAFQTAVKHEEGSGQKRKRTRIGKRRTVEGNKSLREDGENKLSSALEKSQSGQILTEDNLDLSDQNIPTASPNTRTASKVNHKVNRTTSSRIQNRSLTVNRSVEAASQPADKCEEVSPVQRKRNGKRKRRGDQENTNMNLNLEEGECKLSDGKACATLPNTESVSEFNHKVGGNGLYKVQNQEVTVDKSLEDALQTTVRKRKSKGKKRADQDNTNMEQNPKGGKCKSSDGKTCTSSASTETVAEFNHKVGGNGLYKFQNQEVTVDKSLEDALQTTVRKRKSKRKKRADQDNTIMEQNPKEGKCKSSDEKTCTSSPSTETAAEFNPKVGGNGLDKVQNQEVTVHKRLEDVSQTAVRKRKSKGKKRADQENTNMEQNSKEGKCKSSDGKSCTSSPSTETVTEFNPKVGGNGLDKVQNQEVTVDKRLEDASQTAVRKRKRKNKGEKHADQDNTNMEQNPKVGKCKSSDGKICTSSPSAETVVEFANKVGGNGSDKVQNQEVAADRSSEALLQTKEHVEMCGVQQKRKRRRTGKSRTDKGNENPLESGRNKLSSCLEKNHLVEDLVEDKLDGNESYQVLNQEAIVNKSLEASLQTAENVEVCTVQQKRKRRKTSKRRNVQGNNSPLESGLNKLSSILEKNHSDQDLMENKLDASDRNNPSASLTTGTASQVNHKVDDATSCKVHTVVVPVNNSIEAASQTAEKHEEMCVSRKKRKIERKRCDDQENINLLESGCIGVLNITNTKQLELENSVPKRAPHITRKLLILDLNGLLVDIVSSLPRGYQADKRVAKKALLKRPFCDDFLKFCFQRFRVGVWSSRTKYAQCQPPPHLALSYHYPNRSNVNTVVDYIMADFKHELLFCWDQSHCTTTGFYTLADRHKPLVLKELRKLWDKHVPSLPWEKGEYNESNTLLLDDSPYKALLNPPHTAIFPDSYNFQNSNDNSLAHGGDLLMYLEGLATAENVQKYIEQHPFGQGAITDKNQSWSYYLKIINKFHLPTCEDHHFLEKL